MKAISEIIGGIEASIDRAAGAFNNFYSAAGSTSREASDYRHEQEEIAAYFFDRAFLELKLFLEVKGIPQMHREVADDHRRALRDFMRSEMGSWGEPESFWASRLHQYIRAVDTTLGTASPSAVTKELVEILRSAVYSITDAECFPSPPTNEGEIHVRIEAVLRCLFPDLRRKPMIGKAIKNFQPDTGLPSLQTLIEYKFVATLEDVKRVADEILADTRGYVSKEWAQFIYLIYETRRLKPEVQWKELLRASGVGENTQIIVILGEESPRRRRPKAPRVTAGK